MSDQTNPAGAGDFRGSAADKRKDETVMVNADDLQDLVANARQEQAAPPEAPAPAPAPAHHAPAAAPVAAPSAGPNTALLIGIGVAVVLILVVLVVVFAL